MEFLAIFLIFPLVSVVLGIIEQMFIRCIRVIGIVNILMWLILTYTVFNSSFLIWAVIYALIAVAGAYAFRKLRKR